jgi:hypothetical protein
MTVPDKPPKPVWQDYRGRLLAMSGLGIAAIALLFCLPPLPQPQSYHHFADDRSLAGVPNFLNVVSNVPFLLVGLWGLWFVWPRQSGTVSPFFDPVERWPFVLFFAGVGLTGLGSAYYHLEPNNDRLVWDRLPMVVAFMALFAAVLGDRIGVRLGIRLLLPLVALGIGSVIYWHASEQQGRGDLRPYYFVQFYPMLALPLLLLFLPPRYTRTADFFVALGWYVLAKVCEHPGDRPIYELGHIVSGHTLKHLSAAISAYWILRMLQKRRGSVLAEPRP